MKIAIDVMGGDRAPQSVIEGVLLAISEFKNVDLILVGKKDLIQKYFNKSLLSKIQIVHAPEEIFMAEPAALSVRKKRNSSINIGINLLKGKKVDAFISAGNTGAVVCSSSLFLGLIAGVERPGILIHFPTLTGFSLLIDAGANIGPKPIHLLQYGIMAKVYAEYALGKKNPSIGLLNIGEEEIKGTDFLKEAHKLFLESDLNFAGNLEAKELFSGRVDIIVCDGFIGNISLKVSESAAMAMGEFLRRHITKSKLGKLGAFLLKPAISNFKKDIDYSEYGGAPLLGVNGMVIICHGSSSGKAIKNAINVAVNSYNKDINQQIELALSRIIHQSRK
jgi:glycerol-3-phosphate acyltransferase PlsX